MSSDRDTSQRWAEPGLGALPEFVPDAALQARVLRARRRQLRRRGWRRVRAAAVAAALAAAVVFWPQFLIDPASRHVPPSGDMATALHESRTLEAQWRQLAAGRVQPAAALTPVRIIDANLQAAYERGADNRELAPLWQRRNAMLRGLIMRLHGADSAAPTMLTRL